MFPHTLFLIPSFFSITLLLLLLQLRRRKTPSHHPPSYPLIGCLISFYSNRNRLLQWYTHLLSLSPTHTILVHRLGAPRTIITANPHNIQHILQTNFLNFPKGKPFTDILSDFLGRGIFNVDGHLWRTQRHLATHEFTGKSLRQCVIHALQKEVSQNLLPVMDTLLVEHKAVDFQELLARFSFNVICKITLGVDDVCCLDPSVPASPLAGAFNVAAEISARRGAAPLFLIWKVKRWVGFGSERRLKEAVGKVRSHVMGMIGERKQKMKLDGDERREGLLSRLICRGYEEEMIRDMLISFIMAGRDTTSAAMTWFFWLLSQNPQVEEKVLREIRVNVGGALLGYESLEKLRFLKACLCESMRLYPPVPWDSKHAIVDDLLPDGTVVKAGDRVTYFPYGMARMEALWGEDRLEFRPDRWFEEGDNGVKGMMAKVSPFKFPIFQAGPRVCLGKEMAFIQMKFVVVSILRRFRIRRISPDKPLFVPLLTARMAGGLHVLICKREEEIDRR